jgi:hypothetical protein
MKTKLLSGIAALLLATGAAHAETSEEYCLREYGQDNKAYDRCMREHHPTPPKNATALTPRKTTFGTAQAIIGKPCALATRLTAASAVSVMSATIRIFAITETGDLSPASCEKSNFVTSGEYRGSGT